MSTSMNGSDPAAAPATRATRGIKAFPVLAIRAATPGPLGRTPTMGWGTGDLFRRGHLTDAVAGGLGDDAEAVAEGQLMQRLQSGWRVFFSGVWLLYLGGTLQRAWDAPDMGWRIVGLISLLAFCLIYIASFALIRRIRVRMLAQPSHRWAWLLVGTLIALTLLTLPAAGEEVLPMCEFVAVIAMFVLPTRAAWLLVMSGAIAVGLSSNLVPGWDPVNELAFQIVVTGVAVWGIIQMLQRSNQLMTARAEITSLAVSQERLRFSRDLHDILGHTLTVITLKAELAGRLAHTDADRAEHEMAEVERLARTALADIRATAAGYRDVSLAVELASARTALDAAGIEADLAGAVDDVPTDRVELFGWAVREGVTNVVRHSLARRCRVSVDADRVEIIDDGEGPGRCPSDRGHGLSGLAERAEAAGAQLSVGHADGGGFRLRVGW